MAGCSGLQVLGLGESMCSVVAREEDARRSCIRRSSGPNEELGTGRRTILSCILDICDRGEVNENVLGRPPTFNTTLFCIVKHNLQDASSMVRASIQTYKAHQ